MQNSRGNVRIFKMEKQCEVVKSLGQVDLSVESQAPGVRQL